jgi:hypothetical protein
VRQRGGKELPARRDRRGRRCGISAVAQDGGTSGAPTVIAGVGNMIKYAKKTYVRSIKYR